MSSKPFEPNTRTNATIKYVASDIPKVPFGPSRLGRQKRGPPGRETTHPIPKQSIPQASRNRDLEGRDTAHSMTQAVQIAVLSGQRPQAASEKYIRTADFNILFNSFCEG